MILNINPKMLNSNSQMRVMTYSRVNSQEVKNGFQKLQIKRSFSKMPFFKMLNCMIYILDNILNICYHTVLN